MKASPLVVLLAGLSWMGAATSPELRAPRTETRPREHSDQAATPTAYRESIPRTLVSFEMVPVPGGAVKVGDRSETLAPFHIGRTEVTWDLYDVYALRLDEPQTAGGADAIARPSQPYGAPDYGWGHAGYPVISVTRAAAEAFCEWLSIRTGKRYRLPTEAEWQHAAALGGGRESLADDDMNAVAWHRGNAESRTHPVAARKPDRLGLFDLFGNAAEWVVTGDGSHVTRGGSFQDPPDHVGPAARAVQSDAWNERDPQLPKSRWWLSDAPFVGFRIVHAGS